MITIGRLANQYSNKRDKSIPKVLTLDEIKRLVDVPQLIQAIEAGFVLFSEDKVVVPPVGFLHFDQPPGDVHIKYGFVKNDDVYVLKVASGFYNNAELNLPTSDGLILVFNQQTGDLKLILLDECWLTDMRTAAAGAVAAKHLAANDIHHIGIIGTGVQAKMQLEMLRGVIDCQRCLIWGRDTNKVQTMIADLQASETIKDWGLELKAASDVDELASQCNLIVTTTSARRIRRIKGLFHRTHRAPTGIETLLSPLCIPSTPGIFPASVALP